MNDPVIADDGCVYDRHYLELWFKKCKKDSKPPLLPCSRVIQTSELETNEKLKIKCEEYKKSHPMNNDDDVYENINFDSDDDDDSDDGSISNDEFDYEAAEAQATIIRSMRLEELEESERRRRARLEELEHLIETRARLQELLSDSESPTPIESSTSPESPTPIESPSPRWHNNIPFIALNFGIPLFLLTLCLRILKK